RRAPCRARPRGGSPRSHCSDHPAPCSTYRSRSPVRCHRWFRTDARAWRHPTPARRRYHLAVASLIDSLATRITLAERESPPPPDDGRRRAAVAVLLHDEPSARALLMTRAERDGDPWSGHISLPGGGYQASDGDLRITAIRETREE